MKKFIKTIYNYTINKFPQKYTFKTKNQKYDLNLIINEIIYFLQSGITYRHYRGELNCKTLNKHVLFFAEKEIFKNVYEQLYKKYLKKKKYTKLKYQSIDTSFIMNKNGKQKLGRNKYFKNKRCYKLSFIVDSLGMPNSIHIDAGNINDAKIGLINFNKLFTCIKQIDIYKKAYMFADKMYDSKEFRKKCKQNNYKPIIDYNKRNTKNKKLIKKLSKTEKKIYKKRIKVENTFSLIKKYRRLDKILDSYLSTYKSFIYLGLLLLLKKYI